jgi:anti-sigma factor RsiW
MSQACADWRGDIGAYIVGALSAAAGAKVRRHLENCAACRADYQDLVPVRDLLDRAAPPGAVSRDDLPARLPLEPLRRPRHRSRRHWLAAAATAAAATAAAVAVIVITAHPADRVFRAFDRASGAHAQVELHATPSGTQIDLTISGLPAGERCILVAVSPAGADVAGTWNATYDGAAHVEGTSAIPISQLTALQIESPAHHLLLSILV